MDGEEIDFIPDSVVDNFEDADAEPPGVYESGETISDYYKGATANFARTTSDVVEGGHALASQGTDDTGAIISEPGDGLPRYHDEGDAIRFLIRDISTDTSTDVAPFFISNAAWNDGSPDGYAFQLYPRNGLIRIRLLEDGSLGSFSETSVSISDSTWYWGEVSTPTSEDDTIEYDLYEFDAGSRGSLLGSVSRNDNQFASNRGHGVSPGSGEHGTGAILDGIEIVD